MALSLPLSTIHDDRNQHKLEAFGDAGPVVLRAALGTLWPSGDQRVQGSGL